MKKLIVILILITLTSNAQECNPYFGINNYELDKSKSAGIAYVACVHATGVAAEVGYDNVFVGVLAMGGGHNGATYGYIHYEYYTDLYRVYAGPAYRLNNDPALMIGRVGIDVKAYKNFYITFSLLQVTTNLNYFHYGVKVIY